MVVELVKIRQNYFLGQFVILLERRTTSPTYFNDI